MPLIVPGMGSVEYYQLSRQAFERMIAPYIEETLECCRRVVKSARLQWEQVDRVLLSRVLEYTGGNQHQAARLLGIARQTLRLKLRDLGLHVTHSVEADEDSLS